MDAQIFTFIVNYTMYSLMVAVSAFIVQSWINEARNWQDGQLPVLAQSKEVQETHFISPKWTVVLNAIDTYLAGFEPTVKELAIPLIPVTTQANLVPGTIMSWDITVPWYNLHQRFELTVDGPEIATTTGGFYVAYEGEYVFNTHGFLVPSVDAFKAYSDSVSVHDFPPLVLSMLET